MKTLTPLCLCEHFCDAPLRQPRSCSKKEKPLEDLQQAQLDFDLGGFQSEEEAEVESFPRFQPSEELYAYKQREWKH